MALDAIVEVVARVVGQFVVDVVLVGVFYWPGWIILRMVTFGRYPPSQAQPHNREFVAVVALAVLLAGVTLHALGGLQLSECLLTLAAADASRRR
jgi:hypothetical protein